LGWGKQPAEQAATTTSATTRREFDPRAGVGHPAPMPSAVGYS
jgi:hypothetical protein